MTSDISFVVPSSTPFIRETTGASRGSSPAHWARLSRRVWEGTARTTMSAPAAASSGSVVAVTDGGSRSSGR